MKLGDVKQLLEGSKYEKDSDCIAGSLAKAEVYTVEDVDNLTAKFGPSICRHSIWEFIAFLRAKALEPAPEPKPAPKKVAAKPRAKKAPVKKVQDSDKL